jgi:hypothetical protein
MHATPPFPWNNRLQTLCSKGSIITHAMERNTLLHLASGTVKMQHRFVGYSHRAFNVTSNA